MLVEHVQFNTADSVRLDGLYSSPGENSPFGFDSVILLHGLLGNFYGSRLLNGLAELFADNGVATLRPNTRGHDGINITPKGLSALRIGSAYEIVDDCRHDISAYADFLISRGHKAICLLGHSLGAIKALYSQGIARTESIDWMIALSATRLNFDQFAATEKANVYIGNYDRASKLVQYDKHKELMEIDFPFPTVISAEAYVDKYGPESRYDWFARADKIQQNTLLLFGEKELQTPAFSGLVEELNELEYDRSLIQLEIVEGADHFYTGAIDKTWEKIQAWNQSIVK